MAVQTASQCGYYLVCIDIKDTAVPHFEVTSVIQPLTAVTLGYM